MSIRPSGETADYRRGYDAGYKAAMANADEAAQLRELAKQASPSFRALTDSLAALAGAAPDDSAKCKTCNGKGFIRAHGLPWPDDEVKCGCHAPAKAREDDARDAARYRLLRNCGVPTLCIAINGLPSYIGATPQDPDGPRTDAAIDQAIAALATFAEGQSSQPTQPDSSG